MARKKQSAPDLSKLFSPHPSTVDDLANCTVVDPALVQEMESAGFRTKNPDGMTYRELMICSQIMNAAKGDVQAFRSLMDHMNGAEDYPLVSFVRNNFRESASQESLLESGVQYGKS